MKPTKSGFDLSVPKLYAPAPLAFKSNQPGAPFDKSEGMGRSAMLCPAMRAFYALARL